jgi:putative Mg2+ transporter-C (MgtC) family protein
METLTWWEMLLRLSLAVVFGGALGWNREYAQKPAGMRTHILVCMGSALAMIVSIYMFLKFPRTGADPGRIASQVVTGIGFLGAGAIIHTEGGLVRGLTTAATIWAAAGIGLACGAGMYLLALMGSLLALIVLSILPWIPPFSRRHDHGRGRKKRD